MDTLCEKEPSQQENDIVTALRNLQQRNKEFKALLAEEREENNIYKFRYKTLTEKLSNVNALLEKSVQSLYTVFEDYKNALHMGRSTLQSPTVISMHLASPKPGPSGDVGLSRQLHIEKRPSKESEKSSENNAARAVSPLHSPPVRNEEEQTNSTSHQPENNVLRINEDTANDSGPKTLLKELQVQLSRLPCSVVEEHLSKDKQELPSQSTSLFDLTPSFASNVCPENTSTPLKKLEAMRELGLYPTELVAQSKFINARRRENNRAAKRSSPIKPEKESPVQKKIKMQDKGTRKKQKGKKNTSPKTEVVVRSPKARRARPMVLKEPSLLKKLRAE